MSRQNSAVWAVGQRVASERTAAPPFSQARTRARRSVTLEETSSGRRLRCSGRWRPSSSRDAPSDCMGSHRFAVRWHMSNLASAPKEGDQSLCTCAQRNFSSGGPTDGQVAPLARHDIALVKDGSRRLASAKRTSHSRSGSSNSGLNVHHVRPASDQGAQEREDGTGRAAPKLGWTDCLGSAVTHGRFQSGSLRLGKREPD